MRVTLICGAIEEEAAVEEAKEREGWGERRAFFC